MKTRLVIVRHAQSESNQAKFFAAATNVNITELGRKQAQKTAEFLADYTFDRAYSSPMVRVLQTAAPIVAGRELALEREPDLREINGGMWEGMPYSELEEKYPHDRELWYHHFGDCVCTGGESVSEIDWRVRRVFSKIIEENRGKTVLVATHATPIRLITNHFMGQSLRQIDNLPWAGNASVTVVDCFEDGTFSLELVSYDEHLKQAGLA